MKERIFDETGPLTFKEFDSKYEDFEMTLLYGSRNVDNILFKVNVLTLFVIANKAYKGFCAYVFNYIISF